jgi:nicotinate phosphoribosyltransferase
MENKNLVMDYYQLTMAYSYFMNGKKDEIAYFDMFYRKNPDKGGYVISAGLDEVINYVKNFKFSESDIEALRSKNHFSEEFLTYLSNLKFTGDIYAVEDGTVVFPNEPLITVKANIIEAQLLETALLLHKNFANLITTKASRMKFAAEDLNIVEFGTRRAHEVDAAVKGAKYAYIGGAIGSSCVQAYKEYGVPAFGTMAHSYIESFDSEYEAFLTYAKTFPNNTILLLDTYDTLRSGVKNAIKVAKEYLIPNGYSLKGIRLDSGDLAYLSKKVRAELDKEGFFDTKILASNSLDERLVSSLIKEGAKIDIFGVGENLITAKSDPVIGGVYKLVGIEKENKIIPKMKLSDNIGKLTNPGFKKLYRFYDKNTHFALGDVIALADEFINLDEYILIDETEWKKKKLTNYYVKELQKTIFKDGKLVYNIPSIEEVKNKVRQELSTIFEEIKRFDNPHLYIVDLSSNLLKLKRELLFQHKEEIEKVSEYGLSRRI